MSTHFDTQGLPGFYGENSDTFREFVAAYGEWLESQTPSLQKDLDSSPERFLESFRSQYLSGLPTDRGTSFLVRHIQDLYRTKGTDRGLRLLFRILFDRDIEVGAPGNEVLRASDGTWKVPEFVELEPSARAFTWPGKKITGAESGATAWVDSVTRRRVQGRFWDTVYLRDIRGSFRTGELVTENGNLTGAPTVIGALNRIEITDGASGAETGDLYEITGEGIGGKAVVRAVENATGKMSFQLLEGGWGYSNSAQISLATELLYAAAGTNFPRRTWVVQPLVQMSLSGASGNVSPGDVVTRNGGNTGTVLAVNSSQITLSPTGGTPWYSVANLTSNTWSATVTGTTDRTARGWVAGGNATALGIVRTSTGTFYSNAPISAETRRPLGVAISSTGSANISGNGTFWDGNVLPGDIIRVRSNNHLVGTVQTVANTVLTLTGNATISTSGTGLWSCRRSGLVPATSVYVLGNGAGFQIGSLSNTENVSLFSDLLAGNNSGGVPFLDLKLDGSNSNLASNAYGFSGNTSLGLSGKLGNTLGTASRQIGQIQSISRINQGSGYSSPRFVAVAEPLVAGLGRQELVFTPANTSGFISVGSYIDQTQVQSRFVLSISGNTGAFTLGEGILSNTGSRGILRTSNSTSLTVEVREGTFSTGTVTGTYSNATATVSAATPADLPVLASGRVRAISNTGQVFLTQTSLARTLTDGTYTCSAANGIVIGTGTIQIDQSATPADEPMGLNAEVSSQVVTANGIVTRVEVIDSGHGYLPGTSLTLTRADGTGNTVSGTAVVETQGRESGYWTTDAGKLNIQKIHDNRYYQDFAYEVRTGISLDVYADILKQTLHVSGMELFGRTVLESGTSSVLSAPGMVHES